MANVIMAEEGIYCCPHDARIGGVICPISRKVLAWEEYQDKDFGHVMKAMTGITTYFLRETEGYKLVIIN